MDKSLSEASQKHLDRHHWHINQLNRIKKRLEKDKITIDQVKEIQEDVDYYVENHQVLFLLDPLISLLIVLFVSLVFCVVFFISFLIVLFCVLQDPNYYADENLYDALFDSEGEEDDEDGEGSDGDEKVEEGVDGGGADGDDDDDSDGESETGSASASIGSREEKAAAASAASGGEESPSSAASSPSSSGSASAPSPSHSHTSSSSSIAGGPTLAAAGSFRFVCAAIFSSPYQCTFFLLLVRSVHLPLSALFLSCLLSLCPSAFLLPL